MHKVYPYDFVNRHLLPFEEDRIGLEIVEAIDLHCEKAKGRALFQVKGTFKQTTTITVRPCVVRWLIALSNRLQIPVWAWCGRNNDTIQPKAHFHGIVLIPKRMEKLTIVENTWRWGIMTTRPFNPQQSPFNPIEYIVGKHDIVHIQNPIKPSLAWKQKLPKT